MIEHGMIIGRTLKPKTVGGFVASERARLGLTTADLARLAGYRRVAKGAKRIARFESTNDEVRPFVQRIFIALDASLTAVEHSLREGAIGRREQLVARWLRRQGQSQAPAELLIRCFAGFYARHTVPDDINSMADGLQYARGLALRTGLQVIVRLNSRRHVLLDSAGQVVDLGRS